MNKPSTMSQIEDQIKKHGFFHFGFTPLKPAFSLGFYEKWIDMSFHGDMDYLKRHLAQKVNPQLYAPKANSAIVILQDYSQSIPGRNSFPLKQNRVASYAQGEDYHQWFQSQLKKLSEDLNQLFPKEDFLFSTDSAPVLERDLAYRSGLGWIGKNTCLIHRKAGSLCFIGEILTSMEFSLDIKTSSDHCGKCTRCIEVCPTQALVAPRVMDARKCISYWTIESRTIPPPQIRPKIGDWLFGCDLCQTVCPWNKPLLKPSLVNSDEQHENNKEGVESELRYILETSNRQLMRDLKYTPLARAGGAGLKRNAIIVATNQRLTRLLPIISKYREDPKLGELAKWAIEILS